MHCKYVESGYKCPYPGVPCINETCGNGMLEKELGEVCDDKNNLNGDSCSYDCSKVTNG